MMTLGRLVGVAGFGLGLLAALAGQPFARADGAKPAPGGPVEYNRDIRPILAENCFACHGPDSASRKADLRLDRKADAVKAGAIAPGDISESELIARINSTEKDEVMPPPSTKKKLTAEEKATLQKWVASGAEYQQHWSFLAPKRPEPPKVKAETWVRNPIDRFVLAKLEAKGLKPAPEADRRTLARRLSLDLTGLPPDPVGVEAFVADTSEGAYEKYVDRLMNSKHWGEHRARYWLDAARYADTHGIHFDNYRENWAYRDWVIRAFNANVPFDQFTVEQLAGDLLPNRTLDQQVASAFNRCNITTNEGGTIPEEYLVLYTRDRTETASQVWMGLTTGCAVCHDHKFDPVSQKEFYELAAFFNNTTQAAMDGNIKDTPPTVFVPSMEDKPRWEALGVEVAAAKGALDARRAAAKAEYAKAGVAFGPAMTDRVPSEGLRLLLALGEGSGTSAQLTTRGAWRQVELGAEAEKAWVPGHVSAKALQMKPGVTVTIPEAGDFDTAQAFSYGGWFKLPKGANSVSVLARMDEADAHRGWDLWIENGKIAAHVIHRWPEDALKVTSKTPIAPDKWHHLFATYDGKAKASGLKLYVDGKEQMVDVAMDTLKGSIRSKAPLTLAQRSTSSRANGLLAQDVRVYEKALTGAEMIALATTTRAGWLASKPSASRTPAESDELFTWWLESNDPEYAKAGASLAKVEAERNALKAKGSTAPVSQEKAEEAMAYILFRGEYDKRRDPVKPSTPDVLPPLPGDFPRNRLGLAKWLLLPDHPLTARVTVNRIWQELFGVGIVRTAGDFGITGELPSHPELLDWLAVEFREGGWDLKKFYKMLVTSAAYRQSAQVTKEKLEADPANRLVSRGPRFRMDAEMVRDYALAASGLLVEKVGGPSVRPYQPEGVWEAVAMIGSDTRDYKRDSGDALYRRSLYTFWKRAAPPASMDIFNAPSREVCTVRRERTNTPLQALVTLNDPQFVESARKLAERTLAAKDASGDEARIDRMARRLLARPLTADEVKVVSASLADLADYYRSRPTEAKALLAVGESKPDPALDPAALAAWTMLANEMLNLDEVLNK